MDTVNFEDLSPRSRLIHLKLSLVSNDIDRVNERHAKDYFREKEQFGKAKLKQTVMQKVHNYGNLSHFGDHALTNDNPRSATIITTEKCEFATLNKAAFNKILKQARLRQD